MLTPPWLVVRRFLYEEPHLTQLEFIVSNGAFSATADFYCNVDTIGEIGDALIAFPKRIPDEFMFEHGSEDPSERCYRYFKLRAYTLGPRGHVGLQVRVNLNNAPPNEGIAEFSFQAEPSQIHNLGLLMKRFMDLEHLELQWDLSGGGLFHTHQQTVTPLEPSPSG